MARNEASHLLTLAARVLSGSSQRSGGDRATAIRLLEDAVRLQDELRYFRNHHPGITRCATPLARRSLRQAVRWRRKPCTEKT